MKPTIEFEQWAINYGGCDGGDIGSLTQKSIWICGIEWGGKITPEDLLLDMTCDVKKPPSGYECWRQNLAWIYNWQVMKLLACIHGYNLKQYKKFTEDVQPFVQSKTGFFKMNLYPIAFRNTSHDNWQTDYGTLTGFNKKQDYINWCNAYRLPRIATWCKNYSPRIIICLGKTYRNEFSLAMRVRDEDWNTETIDNRQLSWAKNDIGSWVFLLPFMVNRNGLVRNASIERFAHRIATISGFIKSNYHHCL